MTQTINKWVGTGSELNFTFAFDNYNPEFNELEGYVKDTDGNIDATYTWEIDAIISTQVNLNKALAAGYKFTLQIKIKDELPVWYDANSVDINDDTLNAATLDLVNRIQAVKDHRTNPRIEAEDMNNQTIDNVATATEDHQAVNKAQMDGAVGNIDEQVERAETAAENAETSATNAATSAGEAATSAANALTSEQNAAASEAAVLLQFKGEWLNDYPSGTGTGYAAADVALHDSNLWYSLVDNNTDIPEVGSELPIPTWRLYLPGSADSEELVAKIYRATFNGDGVTTEFDLTANNELFRPTSENQIMYVSVNQTEVIDFELTTRISDGHSLIKFTTPPAVNEDPNGLFNIIVIGATPKIISLEGLPDNPTEGYYLRYNEVEGRYNSYSPEEIRENIGITIDKPIDNNLAYVDTKNVSWYGHCLSDDNSTILSVDSGTPVTGTLPTTTTSVMYYMFVGLDAGSDVIAEFTTDITGATGLSTIVGAKRRVFNVKTDITGDIISFFYDKQRSFVKYTDSYNISLPGTDQTFNIVAPAKSTVQVQCQGSFPVSTSFSSFIFIDPDDLSSVPYARVTTASTSRNTENFTMKISSSSQSKLVTVGTVNAVLLDIVGYYNYV